jgi:hypothetical protein
MHGIYQEVRNEILARKSVREEAKLNDIHIDGRIDVINNQKYSVAVSLQANYTDRPTTAAGDASADFCG